MTVRVSIDDLLFAADWIEAYDGDEGDENNEASQRVGAWIRKEIDRRREEVEVTSLIHTAGIANTAANRKRARAKLRGDS
jgi:hypothetical protein